MAGYTEAQQKRYIQMVDQYREERFSILQEEIAEFNQMHPMINATVQLDSSAGILLTVKHNHGEEFPYFDEKELETINLLADNVAKTSRFIAADSVRYGDPWGTWSIIFQFHPFRR